ncbi:MAG: prolyl oligopeptidase family serine peptidase [Flavobacteriaceae bacterium]
MLIHGDVDNNVHQGGTIRVAEALIKNNKRFKFMIMPLGQRHGFGSMTEYSFWLRADHFSKYFLEKEATSVDITEMNRDKPQN